MDEPWGFRKLERLVYGRVLADSEAMGGVRDDELVSWFQLRCGAYDKGRPELVLDAIQLERGVDNLEEPLQRAALTLALMGWDPHEISAVLTHRRNGRTVERLIIQALRALRDAETRRDELRGARPRSSGSEA